MADNETITYAPLEWDKTGERWFEAGVDQGVLYPMDDEGEYPEGEAWNGLVNVDENPDGADVSDLYADNIKYASLRAAENFKFGIEVFTYPKHWPECDGSAVIEGAPGLLITQQARKKFGFCYRTKLGNDTSTDIDQGYKLHLVYGASASPSSRSHATINDNPDAETMSWDCETDPIKVEGFKKPTAHLVVDSRTADPDALAALEAKLYGTNEAAPYLPLPAEVITTLTPGAEEEDPEGT